MKKKIQFLVAFFVLTSNVFAQKDELKPYVEFLKSKTFPTAKEYILQRFEKYDIVVFSERHHQDMTQYELLLDVITDERFKGNVYTEVGVANVYQKINKFLLNPDFTKEQKANELSTIYRELDYTVLWEPYNYYYLLSEIYEVNKARENKDKILVFPLDLQFDWNDFDCYSQYKLFDDYSENGIIDRNTIMGDHFVWFYEWATGRNPERNKALVIENTYHGYIRIPAFLPFPAMPKIYSTGEYIYKTYPDRVTNVYINYFKSGDFGGLSHDGLLDAAFYYSNTDNIGFDLKNTPFGNTRFDLYNFGGTDYETVNFDYIFDGMVYYYPVRGMKLVTGIPNVYPKEYEEQFFKRLTLTENLSFEESVRQNKAYLEEINQKRERKLQDSVILKIDNQVKQWLD